MTINLNIENKEVEFLISLSLRIGSLSNETKLINKLIKQSLNEDVKKSILYMSDLVKIVKDKPFVFLACFESESGYAWFKKEIIKNQSPIVDWIDSVFSGYNKSSFKKNNVNKMSIYDEIKKKLVFYIESFYKEDKEAIKVFFTKVIPNKQKTRIELWINLFDNSDFIFQNDFFDIFEIKDKKMKCYEILSWSGNLIEKTIQTEQFIELITINNNGLAKAILNSFNDFSQFIKFTKVLKGLDVYFGENNDVLVETIGFINAVIQKNFVSNKRIEFKEKNILILNDLLTEITDLNSFKASIEAKKEMNEIIYFFKNEDKDFQNMALKIELGYSLVLKKDVFSSITKI